LLVLLACLSCLISSAAQAQELKPAKTLGLSLMAQPVPAPVPLMTAFASVSMFDRKRHAVLFDQTTVMIPAYFGLVNREWIKLPGGIISIEHDRSVDLRYLNNSEYTRLNVGKIRAHLNLSDSLNLRPMIDMRKKLPGYGMMAIQRRTWSVGFRLSKRF